MSQNLFSKIQAELIYIDSLIDLSPDPFPVDNEPVRSFGLGPDAIVFRRENAYKFVKAAEKIHGLSEEICNSLTIKEIESCIVKALRLSRQTNNGITLATAEQFFKEIIAKPFVEWVDIRPLWGATSEKDEVKLGPFTFMTRMNVKQKYPKILNMDILPVEDAEIHVYISCTIKSRTGSRASELAEIQYEKFEGVMAYMFGRPSKDYHVAVFNPRPIFAQRSICISSSGNIEGSSGWEGPQERMNISHDYYLNSKNGNERLWNLLRVQSHSEIERRLLLAIEWIGKGIYDLDSTKSFVQYIFALEAILQKQDRVLIQPSIVSQIAETAAFLLAEDYEKRCEIEKLVKDLYGVRSAIVHSGKNEVQSKSLEDALWLARSITRWFLMKSEIRTSDEILEFVKKKKYGFVNK